MQAIAFETETETEIENDIIRISGEYYWKVPYKATITITIVYDDAIQSNEQERIKKRAAYERLKKYRGIIDKDMDYKQELKLALDEKFSYSCNFA